MLNGFHSCICTICLDLLCRNIQGYMTHHGISGTLPIVCVCECINLQFYPWGVGGGCMLQEDTLWLSFILKSTYYYYATHMPG